MRLHWLAAAAALALTLDIAAAQTAQPRARSGGADTAAASSSGQSGTATRARRPRSPAQLRNDQLMRDCGAEWRAGKAQLQAQGKTWRSFLPECRARRARA